MKYKVSVVSKKDIMLKYSSSTLIKKESCRSLNVGYLFLKDIRKTYERSQAFYTSESLYFWRRDCRLKNVSGLWRVNFKPDRYISVEKIESRHIWFQNGLRDCISKRNKKDFNRNEKVEILLGFKKKTRAHKWRNYTVYGLLTLSQLSKTGVSYLLCNTHSIAYCF